MSLFEKIVRILGPTIIFGFLGLLVMTENIGRPTTHRGWLIHDIMSWLSNTLGPVSAGFLFFLVGIAWSMSVYYKMAGRR